MFRKCYIISKKLCINARVDFSKFVYVNLCLIGMV